MNPDALTCKVCGRELFKRVWGLCLYVMEIDGQFIRCNRPRNDQSDPPDPHSWFGGYDHIRDERDAPICRCLHPTHGDFCQLCVDEYERRTPADHEFKLGFIELPHEGRV